MVRYFHGSIADWGWRTQGTSFMWIWTKWSEFFCAGHIVWLWQILSERKKKTSPIFGFALRLCERTYFADTQTVERHSSLAFRTAELRVRANMWIRFSFWEGRKHANNANNRTQFIPYQMSCEHLSIPAVYITNTVFDLYSMNIAILINILEFDRKIGFAHHGLQGISLLFFLHFCIHTFCMLNVERSAKSNAALITCIRKFTQIFVWCNWPEFTWMKCVCVGTRRPNDGHV